MGQQMLWIKVDSLTKCATGVLSRSIEKNQKARHKPFHLWSIAFQEEYWDSSKKESIGFLQSAGTDIHV